MSLEQLKAAGFSDEELAEYKKGLSAGFSEKELDDHYAQGKLTKVGRPAPEWPGKVKEFLTPTGQMIGNIPKDIGRVATGMKEAAQAFMPTTEKPIPPGITSTAGLLAGAGWEAAGAISPKLVPEKLHPAVQAGRETFREKIVEPIKGMIQRPETILPKAAETVKEHPVETFLNILPFSKLAKTATTAAEVSQVKNIEHAVRQGYSKGVMGGMEKGKKISAIDKYFNNAIDSTVDVVRNKKDLSFVNANGETITGRLPKTLGEMGQTVADRESKIYQGFHQMAVEAKESGIRINMDRIGKALEDIANDSVVQNETPGAAKYASEKAKTYRGVSAEVMRDATGTPILGPEGKPVTAAARPVEYDPLQMERAIKIYNQKLAAYQKNPHPEIAKQADIDGVIVKMMREDADNAISKAKGPRYSELKKAYGAHRAVEEDIVRKFNKEMRNSIGKDWVDITDIYSMGEALTGILTGHPLMIAKGGSFAAAKKIMTHYWMPDTRVAKMFDRVDEILEGGKLGGFTQSLGKTAATTAGPSATIGRAEKKVEESFEEKLKKWLEEEK